jgi:hypothetical protein
VVFRIYNWVKHSVFLLGRNHSVQDGSDKSSTALVDWKIAKKQLSHKGEFREVYGAPDYVGIVGSTGVS